MLADFCLNTSGCDFNVRVDDIPEVEKKTVTLLSSSPLCSCAQTITVSPSVATYAG